MRLTQVMLSKGFGGAERYFVDLSLALAARGHQVQVICHSKFMGLPLLDHPNITVCPIFFFASWDPFGARKLERALRDFAPAVIHTHLARAAHVAGRAAHRLQIPLVVKTHNYVDLKYYRHVDHFITTTEDQKRYLLEHRINAERISVIPNFSSMTPVTSPKAPNSASPVLVAYGRMVHKKGFDVLLQALQQLRADGLQARLILGGDGPELPVLRQQAEALGITSAVDFVGWVKTPGDLLDQADLFVLPSRDEPFGIVVLEAMARGKMIVSTRTAGPVEILDERTAWFAEIGDAGSLSSAIRTACSQPENRAQAALARFNDHYSEQAVVPRIEQLYQALAHD